MWPTLLFSAALVFTSLVLMAWHVKAWREADHGGWRNGITNSSAGSIAAALQPAGCWGSLAS